MMRKFFFIVMIGFAVMVVLQMREDARQKHRFSWLEEKKGRKPKKLKQVSSSPTSSLSSGKKTGTIVRSVMDCADDPACLEELKNLKEFNMTGSVDSEKSRLN